MMISRKVSLLLFVTLATQVNRIIPHYAQPIFAVHEITTSIELLNALNSQNAVVLKLSMPGCSHCTAFAKPFEQFSKENQYANITFYNVANAGLSGLNLPAVIREKSNNAIKLPGFPSFIFIKNGKIVDHQIGGNKTILETKLKKLATA